MVKYVRYDEAWEKPPADDLRDVRLFLRILERE